MKVYKRRRNIFLIAFENNGTQSFPSLQSQSRVSSTWVNFEFVCYSTSVSHHFMATRWGNNGKRDRLYFLGLQNHCKGWLQPWNQKTLVPWEKSYDQPKEHIKKQRRYFANKDLSSQSYLVFPVVTYGCENLCFWTMVLEKTLESLLDWQGDQTSQS